MSKKIQKPISILTSITTVLWLSGIVMLAPLSVGAVAVVDGDLIRNPNAEGMAQLDIYIAKTVGEKKFKRLILSPHVFESYAHFDKNGNGDNWDDVMDVDQATMDSFTTTDLVREVGNDKVYRLYAEEGSDVGNKYWLDMTAADFTAVFDADAIYEINGTDTAGYTAGSDVSDASATFPPAGTASTGTLTIALASDTPAAGIAVQSAARLPFTKVNLTATGGDVIVDSLVVQRVGLANDSNFSSLDIVDADTNLPLNNTSKTFNSLHKATFTDDFTITNGTTRSIILAGNMAASLSSYAGEVPALALAAITLKDDAVTNATLPITGNTMTINSTITIGTVTVAAGAYSNSTADVEVGKEDYTYFSFSVANNSVEKVEFSQVKVYQEGSAGLGTDVINLELYQEGTKITDGVVASNKYVNFNFDTITLDKGQTLQFQIKADIEGGSGRTVDLGIYKTTDLLAKGLTYGYNITTTIAGGTTPALSDSTFTISDGTLQVTRSNTVGAGNISVGSDQVLGAFEFEAKGEIINITAITLTVVSSTSGTIIEDSLTAVELVDPNGNVVAGPTDITNGALTVAWTDTFSVPVGKTVYKVRGDLATSGGWSSNDTIYVQVTPGDFTCTGDVTGNSITPTPASSLNSNTQTVKAAGITVTRNTLPADSTIVSNQNDLVLSSWNFDATASGENIRVTSVLWAGRGHAATNTNALAMFVDENKNGTFDSATETALSPINSALADSDDGAAATSTFALSDPIIITKGTSVHIALKGDKDSVVSNDTENWGLTDDGGASIIAYGVTTGNAVTEVLTEDDGPTLTSVSTGTLTVETEGNPSSAILLAGTTGNVFTNVNLAAKYEDLKVNNIIVYVGDGSYEFNAGSGEYRDVTNVSLYDGTTLLKSAGIPSTGLYTFEFDTGELTIPKSGSKTITVKADMSTIDPDTANAPGTANADLKIGLGGINGIKTTGSASNTEITGSNEDFRSSTSSAMVLRVSKPTVALPTASNSLGAATTLSNGNIVLYAYKVTADASGGDVLLYRNTFVFATTADGGMTITSVRIDDQSGNTIKAASSLTEMFDANTEAYLTATFNSPAVSNGDDKEAIKIAAGSSATFKVYGTVAGASTGENITTFLVGDLASTSADVNTDNKADGFWAAPTTDLSSVRGNFIWSDNYKNYSITGTGTNNATTAAQWYNGHLVSGLGNVVSTTGYTIGY